MKRCTLIGYYGNSNFGDDLILKSFVRYILEYFGEVKIVNSGTKPYHFSDDKVINVMIPKIKIKFLSKFNLILMIIAYFKNIIGSHTVYFAGGTQLFETKKNRYFNLLVYSLTILFAKILRARVIHIGVGVNKPITLIGKKLLLFILKFSDKIYVRDRRSYEVCKGILGDNDKVVLSCDLAYIYDYKSKEIENKDKVFKMGINIFPYFSLVEHDSYKDDLILSMVKRLIKTEASNKDNIELHLIGSQLDHSLCDIDYMMKVIDISSGVNIKIVNYQEDVDDFISRIRGLDVLISMRLHLLISSKIIGLPRITAISYQEKVASECDSVGISYFDVNNDMSYIDLDSTVSIAREKRKLLEIHLKNEVYQ